MRELIVMRELTQMRELIVISMNKVLIIIKDFVELVNNICNLGR